MNYRQWKKNYKKKHGCNPPLEEDKRKQAKVLRKAIKQIDLPNIADWAKNIVNGFARAFQIIGDAFIDAGKSMRIE